MILREPVGMCRESPGTFSSWHPLIRRNIGCDGGLQLTVLRCHDCGISSTGAVETALEREIALSDLTRQRQLQWPVATLSARLWFLTFSTVQKGVRLS